MTESSPLTHALSDDLHFVRNVVESKNRLQPSSSNQLIVWALYSLLCIPAYDYLPHYAGRINLIGWLTAAAISFALGKRAGMRSGEFDRAKINRIMLHWFGGIALMFIAVYGLALGHSGINETGAGQLSVILVGFLYFTAGIHIPESRFMRWAGPIIILSGIAIGWLPELRWTAMGLIFTACLMVPVIFGSRKNFSTPAA